MTMLPGMSVRVGTALITRNLHDFLTTRLPMLSAKQIIEQLGGED
jgi:hypothetical protein